MGCGTSQCGGSWSTFQSDLLPALSVYIQGGAEPTDTFQMVIDNIWKEGKISETIYK